MPSLLELAAFPCYETWLIRCREACHGMRLHEDQGALAVCVPDACSSYLCGEYVTSPAYLAYQDRGNDVVDLTLQAQAISSPGAAEQLLRQVLQDLAPFRTGISQNMVEQVYCSQFDPGFRVQIINNRVYIAGEAAPAAAWLSSMAA